MSEVFSLDNSQIVTQVLKSTDVLRKFAEQFGIVLGEVSGAKHIRGKQYGSRIDIPFEYDGEIGKMITIGFNAGDGTGDESTYAFGSLQIPQEYHFEKNPTRVHPRKKEGTVIECIVPIGTVEQREGQFHRNNTELVELGIVGGVIGPIGVARRDDLSPKMFHTVKGEGMTREGDPHAIFAPKDTRGRIQIAAFIAANDHNSAIARLLMEKGSHFAYQR